MGLVVLGACPKCGDLLPLASNGRLLAGWVRCRRDRCGGDRYHVPLYKVKVQK